MHALARLVITDSRPIKDVSANLLDINLTKSWSCGDRKTPKSQSIHSDYGIVLELYRDIGSGDAMDFVETALTRLGQNIGALRSIRSAYPGSEWQLSLYAEINPEFVPSISLRSSDIALLASLEISFDLDLA